MNCSLFGIINHFLFLIFMKENVLCSLSLFPGTAGSKGEKGDRGDRGEKGERGLIGPKGESSASSTSRAGPHGNKVRIVL